MTREAIALFRETFGVAPSHGGSAPGRVNLIGEHTDYNGGPVLPMAIARRTVVMAGPGQPGVIEVISTRDRERGRVEYRVEPGKGTTGFVVGVARALERQGIALSAGARLAIASDVPVGAGLASSAALTVSTAYGLAALAGTKLAAKLAWLVAYQAEHDHVGVRCGTMDQTIAALGKKGHALLLECSSGATMQIPFRGTLLLVDTGVRHDLAHSAFNTRRAECEAAVEKLREVHPGLRWLALWPAEEIPRLARLLPPTLRARAQHVVGETVRTRAAARLLKRGRLGNFGKLMYQSHESCRRRYECSAPELDLVVQAARRAGAMGARMTGAGWGGAALVLIRPRDAEKVSAVIGAAFERRFGRAPAITGLESGSGARVEKVPGTNG
ncbi:MAG TPA: galactokinase [Gemmatimonadales bacterium]|nr:galactokinase [Gemmatimonadales bacterium]